MMRKGFRGRKFRIPSGSWLIVDPEECENFFIRKVEARVAAVVNHEHVWKKRGWLWYCLAPDCPQQGLEKFTRG